MRETQKNVRAVLWNQWMLESVGVAVYMEIQKLKM